MSSFGAAPVKVNKLAHRASVTFSMNNGAPYIIASEGVAYVSFVGSTTYRVTWEKNFASIDYPVSIAMSANSGFAGQNESSVLVKTLDGATNAVVHVLAFGELA